MASNTYVFQTGLLSPDTSFGVAQAAEIADEDALDLVVLISDTHSGATAMGASELVSGSGWQLNQLLKNIRVAFEAPVNAYDKQELCAVDYDQSNTKTNVKRWLLDMAGDGVDEVLGNSPGTPDMTASVNPNGDWSTSLSGADTTNDNDKRTAGGKFDFVDAMSTAIGFAWVKGTDSFTGTDNESSDLWARTLRFRNQILQDRIRTDILAACKANEIDLGANGSTGHSFLMSQVVQCGVHDKVSDPFRALGAGGTAGVVSVAGTGRPSGGQGWVMELARRVVAHSLKTEGRHVTFGGHDTGALIDNMPIKNDGTPDAHKTGGSKWIRKAGSGDAGQTPNADDTTCILSTGPRGTAQPETPLSASTVTLQDANGDAATGQVLVQSNALAASAYGPALQADEGYAVYGPNETRFRAALQAGDQICLSLKIKVRNSQDGGGGNTEERSAKVGFLFRQQAAGGAVPTLYRKPGPGLDVMSNLSNANYQAGTSTAAIAGRDIEVTPQLNSAIYVTGIHYPHENVDV